MSLASPSIERLAHFARQRAGLAIDGARLFHIEGRLQELARRKGFADANALVASVAAFPAGPMADAVLYCLLNHETFFFRDVLPFTLLQQQILPALRRARGRERHLRIWSAAASTGQEAYSLAMLFAEAPDLWHDWTIDIVATDISETALARARRGVYSHFEVQRGLSPERLKAHFSPCADGWEILPALRARVAYRPQNLHDSFVHLGSFDIILCRNVLLYLEQTARRTLLGRLARSLRADGVLLLGAAESVMGIDCGLASAPGNPMWLHLLPASAA